MHKRTIECEGFLRDDGLWEVEAWLVDTKPFTVSDPYRTVEPGGALHDIGVRLAIDASLTIRETEVMMRAIPFPTCIDVKSILQRLVGERIGKGWREVVRQKIGRLETCTHVTELLGPAVTTLFQAMTRDSSPEGYEAVKEQDDKPPFFINGCHSWRSEGPVVAKLFPQFATKPTAGD